MRGEPDYVPEIPKNMGKKLFSRTFRKSSWLGEDTYGLLWNRLHNYEKNYDGNLTFFDPSSLRFGAVEVYLIAGSAVYCNRNEIKFFSETPAGLEAILALFGIDSTQDISEGNNTQGLEARKT